MITNDLTYTVKLKRREIIQLCIFIAQFKEDLDTEGAIASMEEIRKKLHNQYKSEDEKRMEDR